MPLFHTWGIYFLGQGGGGRATSRNLVEKAAADGEKPAETGGDAGEQKPQGQKNGRYFAVAINSPRGLRFRRITHAVIFSSKSLPAHLSRLPDIKVRLLYAIYMYGGFLVVLRPGASNAHRHATLKIFRRYPVSRVT